MNQNEKKITKEQLEKDLEILQTEEKIIVGQHNQILGGITLVKRFLASLETKAEEKEK